MMRTSLLKLIFLKLKNYYLIFIEYYFIEYLNNTLNNI